MHLKLTIQYDGTEFSGSQLQAEERGRTVQGELEKALAHLAGTPMRVALAGRTDSGVHALGQVASLDFPGRPRLDKPEVVQKALNAILPPDLSVTGAEEAAEGFHARFSARQRAYRYLVWYAPSPAPLLRRHSLHVRRSLDIEAMARAVGFLEGTHDLAAFAGQGMGVPEAHDDPEGEAQGSGSARPSTVRTVYLARVVELSAEANFWDFQAPGPEAGRDDKGGGRLIAVDFVANAFLPQMIRTIVGTLLEVGYAKLQPGDMRDILESRDRRRAGPTAKPHGLCLLWVDY